VSGALLVQLSDPHVGARWAPRERLEGLRAAVAATLRLGRAPDAVLLSGDLADGGRPEEYERVCEVLEPLGCPLHALAGNHDDRAALRAAFGAPGRGDEPVRYATRAGELRVVVLDTKVAGAAAGALGAEQLAWLDAVLAAERAAPTLIAMHHQPIATALPEADRIGLAAADRTALAEVVDRHPQVLALAAGHVHRTVVGALAGRPVMVAPSIFAQARLELAAGEARYDVRRGGFAVHVLAGGEIASHVEQLPDLEGWRA
jgi:3',5'-cyclic AMP phosphodiesterase CpdA